VPIAVDDLDLAAPVSEQHMVPDCGRAAFDQGYERNPVRAVRGLHVEHLRDRRVQIDVGGERVDGARLNARPRDEQRRVSEIGVHRYPRFTESVALTEVMPMVSAQDDRGVVPEMLCVELVEDATEPVVDHRDLRLVVGAYLPRRVGPQPRFRDRLRGVRRPDEPRPVPLVVVARRPRIRRVERLVRIELVDEQEEAVVETRARPQPFGRGPHRARPGEVVFRAKPSAGLVVTAPVISRNGRERGCSRPRRIGARTPRIAFVAAHVIPRGEISVIVLSTHLEEVGMVGDEHRRDFGPPQLDGDRILPHLDRAPRTPQEVERADEEIVTRRHAGQRPGPVAVEAQGACPEPVDVGRVYRLEIGPLPHTGCSTTRALLVRVEITVEEVPVQAVEQDDDDVAGCAQVYTQRFSGSDPAAYSMHCTSNWIGNKYRT
jgi:hypothetical protein